MLTSGRQQVTEWRSFFWYYRRCHTVARLLSLLFLNRLHRKTRDAWCSIRNHHSQAIGKNPDYRCLWEGRRNIGTNSEQPGRTNNSAEEPNLNVGDWYGLGNKGSDEISQQTQAQSSNMKQIVAWPNLGRNT